jgi:hypothetical protein
MPAACVNGRKSSTWIPGDSLMPDPKKITNPFVFKAQGGFKKNGNGFDGERGKNRMNFFMATHRYFCF